MIFVSDSISTAMGYKSYFYFFSRVPSFKLKVTKALTEINVEIFNYQRVQPVYSNIANIFLETQ
jgi:hypothetical protein